MNLAKDIRLAGQRQQHCLLSKPRLCDLEPRACRLPGDVGKGRECKEGGLTRTASAKMQRRQNQGVSRGRSALPALGMWHC